jgi:hypothetical protein
MNSEVIWIERNAHTYEGSEIPVVRLKLLLLRSLYEWTVAIS